MTEANGSGAGSKNINKRPAAARVNAGFSTHFDHPAKRPRADPTTPVKHAPAPASASAFATFDSGFHAKPKPAGDIGDKGWKKPTFHVPDAKELMSAFNLDNDAGPSKLPPRLPPRAGTSVHDEIMKRSTTTSAASPNADKASGSSDSPVRAPGVSSMQKGSSIPKLKTPSSLLSKPPNFTALLDDSNPQQTVVDKQSYTAAFTSTTTPLITRTSKPRPITPFTVPLPPPFPFSKARQPITPARRKPIIVPFNALHPLPKAEPSSPPLPKPESPNLRALSTPKFVLGSSTKARLPKTPLRDVTPAPFDALAKVEGAGWVKAEEHDSGGFLLRGVGNEDGNAEDDDGDEQRREREWDRERKKELTRGLMISPEKPGEKEKRRKFIRNGLAERAQELIARSRTAFTLWSKDLETSVSRSASSHVSRVSSSSSSSTLTSSSFKRLRPDIRLRITSVVHVTRTSTSSHTRGGGGGVRTVLARCTLLSSPPELIQALRERTGGDGISECPDTLFLFSFSAQGELQDFALRLLRVVGNLDPSSSHSAPGVGAGNESEGAEVLVWKPWYIVNAPASPSASSSSKATSSDPTSVDIDNDVFSAPKPPSTPTVFCSRFVVLPRPPSAEE